MWIHQRGQCLCHRYLNITFLTIYLVIIHWILHFLVYDDENCNEGDWDPLKIMDGESRSFSILKGITNLFNYKNDIESIVVKKGCALKVYKDSDFSDGEYTFTAPANRDLFIKDLEDDDNTEYLNEDIESLRCSCKYC